MPLSGPSHYPDLHVFPRFYQVWLLPILLPVALLHVALGSLSGPLDATPPAAWPASQPLSHLCTFLPPSNLLSVPSLPQCPWAYHTPVPGSPCIPAPALPLLFPTLSSLSGPGKSTACPRVAESSRSRVCYPKPCSLFLVACHHFSFLLSFILCLSQSTSWPDNWIPPCR